MTYSDGSKTRDLWFFCPLSACINHLHTSHNRDARTNQSAASDTQLGRRAYRIAQSENIFIGEYRQNKLTLNLYRKIAIALFCSEIYAGICCSDFFLFLYDLANCL